MISFIVSVACSLVLISPNPNVWHAACKKEFTKGTYKVSYNGDLYADRINEAMDDPGRIFLSASVSTRPDKPTIGDFTSSAATTDKVFSFETQVGKSMKMKFRKTTTLYLIVNAHDNDYDNDIEHLAFTGCIHAEKLR